MDHRTWAVITETANSTLSRNSNFTIVITRLRPSLELLHIAWKQAQSYLGPWPLRSSSFLKLSVSGSLLVIHVMRSNGR